MPIVEVELVGPVPARVRRGLARRIADEAGLVLGTPPHGTWARVRVLPPGDYAENEGGPSRGVRPVFVHVIKARRPTGRKLAREVARLTEALSRACDRPAENVHLVYAESAEGRVAFGGKLVGRR